MSKLKSPFPMNLGTFVVLSALFAALCLETGAWARSRCREDVSGEVKVTHLNDLERVRSIKGPELRQQRKSLRQWEQRRQDGKPVILVSVPSINLPKAEIAGIKGIEFYEHRGLWNILRARDPNVHVIFISSQRVPDFVVDHLLEGLPPAEAKSMRKRIHLRSLNDTGSDYLSDKVRNSPETLHMIRTTARQILGEDINSANTVLNGFISESSLGRLASELGISVTNIHPSLGYLNSKAGNREAAAEAHIPFAVGFNSVRSTDAAVKTVDILFMENQGVGSAWVKTNYGTSGEGIIKVPFEDLAITPSTPKKTRHRRIREFLEEAEQNGKTWKEVSARLATDGGVNELGVPHKRAPSVQLNIGGDGKIDLLSTHMQILQGTTYKGARQPAYDDPVLVKLLTDYALSYANTLARHGVVGRVALDFFEVSNALGKSDFVFGEANIREGGTTHPRETVAILNDAYYDHQRGGLVSRATGKKLYYVMTDNFVRSEFVAKELELLWWYFTKQPGYQDLVFDPAKNSGVKFHMLSAIPQHGKMGLVAFGRNPAEAQHLLEKAERLMEDAARILGQRYP
ncbi:MAG: hypothetical protein H6624_04270 [Bdellovibrionaceae bacterium]|nr:hypothetical protein [Bdellovibrionales bacterium]MCB9083531.1 hypothetical protein [Pseudobdellovibrionaceae bacterium]